MPFDSASDTSRKGSNLVTKLVTVRGGRCAKPPFYAVCSDLYRRVRIPSVALGRFPETHCLCGFRGFSIAEKIAIFVYRLFTTDQVSDTANLILQACNRNNIHTIFTFIGKWRNAT